MKISDVNGNYLSYESYNENGRSYVTIKDIFVKEELRGKGYGTQLINVLLKIYDNENVEIIISRTSLGLSDDSLKQIIKFFIKFNFKLSDSSAYHRVLDNIFGYENTHRILYIVDMPISSINKILYAKED